MNSQTEVERISHLCTRASAEGVVRTTVAVNRGPDRLTKEQNDEIAELYKAGHRPVDIARLTGVTEWTVHHRLNRSGIQRRPISMTAAEIQEALRLNDEGTPITALTKRFNRSWKTIAKELRAIRNN